MNKLIDHVKAEEKKKYFLHRDEHNDVAESRWAYDAGFDAGIKYAGEQARKPLLEKCKEESAYRETLPLEVQKQLALESLIGAGILLPDGSPSPNCFSEEQIQEWKNKDRK